jgi:hypothetical protein
VAADYFAHVYEPPGARHALLRGVPRQLLADLNVSALWSPLRRGFLVRAECLPDVVAMLEWQNVAVRHHPSEPKS